LRSTGGNGARPAVVSQIAMFSIRHTVGVDAIGAGLTFRDAL
jgi:hypothetical protein